MRDARAAAQAQRTRRNERYLPGVAIADAVTVTDDPAALGQARAVLLVVPAQAIRPTLTALAANLPDAAPLVICAKGIERGTDAFMSDVAAELRPHAPVAILSGPSFAADVARGLPTAVTLAAADAERAAGLAAALSSASLRVYFSTDVRGVEIGGAGKNVLAVAVGIVAGRGLGDSAKAALTARGFAELTRFAAAHGARPETLMGLSGLGDLVLTCGSEQSRNFSLGLRIGRGALPADASGGKLAEGAFTAEALVALARRAGVEMPVSEAVAAVLAGRLTVDAAIEALMARPLRAEM
jgi:glycerol-3-phosphate dehydrogenase (NAD(P)+)